MNTNLAFERQPNAPNDEKVSNDLVKQIRKLRWIGMDGEAEFLQITLRHLQAADVVWAPGRKRTNYSRSGWDVRFAPKRCRGCQSLAGPPRARCLITRSLLCLMSRTSM